MKSLLSCLVLSSLIATNVFAAPVSTVVIKAKNASSNYLLTNDGYNVTISLCKVVEQKKECHLFAVTTSEK